MTRTVTDEERLSIQFATAGSSDRMGLEDADSDDAQAVKADRPGTGTPQADRTRLDVLDDIVREIRVAANARDPVRAFAALKEHDLYTAKLRAQARGYNDLRQHLATRALAMMQPDLAGADLVRHLRPDAARLQLRGKADGLTALGEVLGTVFQPAADWLAGLVDETAISRADLGLVADFRKLGTYNVRQQDYFKTFYHPLEAAARLGAAMGLKVVAIPAFAFPLLNERPSHIMAYHSTGRFPGFTHYKRADLPGYLSLDQGGYSGWSTLSGASLADLDLPSLDEATAVCDRLRREIVAANVSKYTQDTEDDDPTTLPERFVFVPLQIPTDRTQGMARFTMEEMLDIVISRFRGTGIAVVVEPHPRSGDLEQLARLMAQAEAGDIVLRFDSVDSLVRSSLAVITINSGVGSEAMLHGKPLYCFGGADYDAVAHRITSAEQFNALSDPLRLAVSDDDLTRFTAYYRTRFLVERDLPGRLDEAMMERVIDPALAGR